MLACHLIFPEHARLGVHFRRHVVTASVTLCKLYCDYQRQQIPRCRELSRPLRIPPHIGNQDSVISHPPALPEPCSVRKIVRM